MNNDQARIIGDAFGDPHFVQRAQAAERTAARRPKPPRINPALMAQARTEAQDRADEQLRNTMAVIDSVGTNPHVARREFQSLMGAPKGR